MEPSNNGVDNIRDLIDTLRSAAPPNAAYKIYIIDEVHMLSVAAFNALLKSLEEPPANTIFIFATTEAAQGPRYRGFPLPATRLSQNFYRGHCRIA